MRTAPHIANRTASDEPRGVGGSVAGSDFGSSYHHGGREELWRLRFGRREDRDPRPHWRHHRGRYSRRDAVARDRLTPLDASRAHRSIRRGPTVLESRVRGGGFATAAYWLNGGIRLHRRQTTRT